MVLVQVQYFETGTRYGPEILQLCGKKIKTKSQKSWEKIADNFFALPPSSHPEQGQRWIERFPFCENHITTIIPRNMFGNIKSAVFTYGGIGEENCIVELACLQMLNIGLLQIFIYLFTLFKVGIILVLTNKNQRTN